MRALASQPVPVPKAGCQTEWVSSPTVGQRLWHFTTGIKQTMEQHMNHDTHTMMIQQNATVRGLEEPLTVDMVYPANVSFIFIHLLCLSYVTKIMKNPVLWYLTLKFVLPHCISLQPRSQMCKSPTRNRNNLQISGK